MTAATQHEPHADAREVKQVLIIRRDLGMRRGKEIAQGAHASLAWLTNRVREHLTEYATRATDVLDLSPAEEAWVTGSFRKVTLQVPDEASLQAIYDQAKAAGLEAHLIVDSGFTEFHGVPTPTAVGIGPDYDEKINAVTGKLRLY